MTGNVTQPAGRNALDADQSDARRRRGQRKRQWRESNRADPLKNLTVFATALSRVPVIGYILK